MHIAIVDDISEEADKIKEILYRISSKKCINFDISYFESGESFLNAFKKKQI